jgi:hypothetical protein
MIKATYESPCPRPCERFKIEITYIVQDIVIVSSDPANYEKFVFMEDSSVPGSSLWDRTGHCRLRPVCRFQIEYDKVGQVSSVLILTTENEQFVPLIKSCSMAW